MDSGEYAARLRAAGGTARTVHAYVVEAVAPAGVVEIGVVFLDSRGRFLRMVKRALPPAATRELAVFRGILLAFWTARRLGARAVIVHSDNRSVVRQINGEFEVAPELVGPYLQIRALLHAYRITRVEVDDLGRGREALAAAEAAGGGGPRELLEGLPLWAHAAVPERSTA